MQRTITMTVLTLNRIQLDNIISYKNLDLTLPSTGVSVFRGLNRSGKSILFSTLANLRFGSHPLTKKKNASKVLLKKGSRIDITLSNNEHKFELSQQLSSGVKLGLKIDDKEQTLTKIKTAKDAFYKVWPQTEYHFYSLSYLTSYKAHYLLEGTAPLRQLYFNQIFELDLYERIHKEIQLKIKDLKSDEVELTVLQDRLNQYIKTHKEASEKIKPVINIDFDFEEIQKQHLEYINQKDLLSQLKTDDSLEKLRNKKQEYLKLLSNINTKIDVVKDKISKYKHNNEIYEKQKDAKEKLLKLKNISKPIPEFSLMLDKSKSRLDDLLDYQEKHNKFISLNVDCGSNIKEVEDQIKKLEFKYKEYSNIKDKNKCSSCGQKINNSLKKKAKKWLKNYNKKLSNLELILTKTKLLDYKESKQAVLVKAKKNYKKLISLQESNKLNEKYYTLKKQLESSIQDIEYKDDSILKKKLKKLINKKEDVETKINFYKKQILIKEQLKSVKPVKNYEEYKLKYETYQKQVNANQIYENIIEDAERHISKLKPKIEKLEVKLSDIPLYKILLEAYSNKGIKLDHINSIAEAFEYNLNRWSSLIFGEPFQFKINISKSKFDILATRSKETSDVHFLSGSESRAFQLLCMISILPLVPAHLRTNFVCLDEMEHGLDKHSRYLYTNEYLPFLRTMVDQVFIISPLEKDELYVPDAAEYLVQKIKGCSTINRL